MAKYLHKILVPISEVEIEDATREDRAQRIVEYAENAIEPYRGEVFSSRWLACHGDRAAYYSEPVFYAADNLEGLSTNSRKQPKSNVQPLGCFWIP